MQRLLVATGMGISMAACGGTPEAEHAEFAHTGAASSLTCLPEPAAAASPSFVATKSRLAVSTELSDKRLQELVDDVLPTTVAHDENVKAGAAGRATYEIKRSKVAVSAGPAHVKLTTPLRGDIQLCKPLGAVCFGYGRCHPEWEAKVTLPKQLTQARAPHVDFDLKLTKGCVLSPVRFDATSELTKITEQQERKIEEQINRVVVKQYKHLQHSLSEGLHAIKLTSGECVGFKPAAAQLALQTTGVDGKTRHTMVVEVTGSAKLGCEATKLEPSFGVEVADAVPNDTSVVFEEVVASSEIERFWVASGPHMNVSVRPSGSDLVVRVSPLGACGVAWGRFAPELSASGVVLRPVQVSDPNLTTWVEQRGPLFGSQIARQRAALDELMSRVSAPTEANGSFARDWKFELVPKLGVAHSVRVVDEGLVLVGQVQGLVRGQLRRDKTQ